MYSKELEELISAAIADGVITDKERAVIRNRAEREGEDADEVEVYMEGRLHQRGQINTIHSPQPSIGEKSQRHTHYKFYLFVMLLCVLAVIASHILITQKPLGAQVMGHIKQIDKATVLGLFKSKAQLATTTVEVRRMGILDPEAENVSVFRPSTWKIGARGCIVPVEMTLKYGIDLREMNESDIELGADDVVKITLPTPKIIDHNLDPKTNPRDVVSISTGLRDEIGEHTIQKIKMQVMEGLMADTTLLPKLYIEVMENTKSVFASMLQSMGLKPEFTN